MLVLIMCLATPVEGRTLTTAEDSASERVASDEGRSEEVSPDGHHSSTGAGTGGGAGGGVSNMFHKIGSKLKGSMMGGSALSSEEGEWEKEEGGAPTAAQVKTDFASLMAREKKKLLGEVEVEVEGDEGASGSAGYEMGATGLELLRRRFEVTTTTSIGSSG